MPFRRDILANEMKRRGWKQKDAAREFGTSQSTVSDWLTGKKEPRSKQLSTIAEVLGLYADQLLSEGREWKDLSPDEKQDLAHLYDAAFADDVVFSGDELEGPYAVGKRISLPVVSEVHAGDPVEAIAESDELVPVELDRVRGGFFFWVRVAGESMKGAGITPGSLVLIRRQEEVGDTDIALVDIEDEGACLKRVWRANGDVILLSENPEYPPRRVAADKVRIIGKAESLHREL